MIDPNNITNFNRYDMELEEFLIFAICVAGKRADQTARKVDQFLENLNQYVVFPEHVFKPHMKIVQTLNAGKLTQEIERVRLGQYGRIKTALAEYATKVWSKTLDLKTCSPEQLESIKGIGPKTARFFIMHTRKDTQVAALDTHILKWLRDIGYDVPRSTPVSGPLYKTIEQIFLGEAERRNMDAAKLDLAVWVHYSEKHKGIPFQLNS